MIRCFYLSLLLLLSLSPALAMTPTEITLKNGIPLIHIESNRTEGVTHMVWYRAGARQDPAGKEGLAHFVEHLMFKGTETYEAKAFSNFVNSVGGRDNAFTSWDFTAYFQTVPTVHLAKVMEMEADRLQKLRFTQEEFDKEKLVVLAERAQIVEQSAVSRLREAMQLALYPQQAEARPIIGWPASINAITFEDARAFYETHYRPENIIIVIAGAISADAATALAETHYGSLKLAKESVVNPMPAASLPLDDFQYVVASAGDDVPAPTLLRRYPLPSTSFSNPAQRAAFDILAYIVGGSPSSRLAQQAIDTKSIATHINVDFDETLSGYSEVSVFATGQIPAFDHQALTLMLEATLKSIAKEGVKPEELATAKSALKSNLLYSLDSLSAPAFLYGRLAALGIPLSRYRDYTTLIDNLTPADVKQAAGTLLAARSVTGILQPTPREKP